MNRLMKAEFYRFRHTGHLFLYTILMAVVFAVIPPLSSLDYLNQPLSELLNSFPMMCMFVLMLIPVCVTGITGQLYNKGHLGYYEIMAGNSKWKIIMSKVMTVGVFYAALTFVATTVFYIFAGIRNGLGELDHPMMRLALYAVVVVHVMFCSVLIMMQQRNVIASCVLVYFRFMLLDSVGIPLIALCLGKIGCKTLANQMQYMIIMNQMNAALVGQLDATLVLHIIIGTIVEFLFWYLLVYMGLKNKKIA